MKLVENGDKLRTQYAKFKSSGEVAEHFYVKNNNSHILLEQISLTEDEGNYIVLESGADYAAYKTNYQEKSNMENKTNRCYVIDIYGVSRLIDINDFNLEVLNKPIEDSDYKKWFVVGAKSPKFRINAVGNVYID